jgi:hypothetical protein
VLITYLPQNIDSHKLAHDFLDLLTEAGWKVELEDPPTPYTLEWDDVQIGVSDLSNPTDGAQVLLDALIAVGVKTPGNLVRCGVALPTRYCLMVGTGC